MTPPMGNPTTCTEAFLQTAKDWPNWENALLHKAGKHNRYVLRKEPAVKEVSVPQPADYTLTAEAKRRLEKAKRELQDLDDGDEFDIVIGEDGSRKTVEKPHRPRQEILDDLVVSTHDLTRGGQAAWENDLATFEARYTIWRDFEEANNALRMWMRDSVCPTYANIAFKHLWDTPTWYRNLRELVDYRGPSRKALRRQALKELSIYPPVG